MRIRNQSVCASIVFLFLTEAVQGQPPAPVQPNPQAPTIGLPTPLGMQRGTALELTLTGANLADPAALQASFPARITFPTDNNNGKDNAKLRVRLEVPKDAPLGFHTIRLATARGMSNFRLFCIDDLPQVLEMDTNRTKTTAQAVPVPCVVVGRADAEVSDYYKITVKAGERVSFEILGRRLGSAFDPQIQLYEAKSGRELPGGHSNDAPGLQTDPRLTYTFKEAGEYLIEVRDVSHRGGPDFYYRLRIGDFPCATTPVPMAARRGSQVPVSFAGPTVDGVAPVEVYTPADPTIDTIWVAPKGANGLYGWPVALALSDLDEFVEQEPNNEPSQATRIHVPCGVTGRFQEKGDVDQFVFSAKKGQRLIIDAQTHELYSPTEVYMVLKDAKGGQLAATNPTMAPRIDFTGPADGDYYIVVEHLTLWGGPTETYRLTVTPYEPGFDLTLGLDRYDLSQGGTASIPIMAVVRRDYNGPIEVSVAGPPGVTGSLVINPGPPPPPNQPAARLPINASLDVPVGAYHFRVVAKATVGGKQIASYANVRTVVSQSLGGLPYPPRQLDHEVALAVKERPPFGLAAKIDPAEVIRGSAGTVTVTAARVPGFADEITLAAVGLPPNVAVVLKNIAKGQNEVKLELKPAASAPLGKFPVTLTGKSKYHNVDFTVSAPAVVLTLVAPFDLKVELTPVKLVIGAKAKIKVTAVRRGYQGPIAIEVRNLPANVTAPKATIAQGQDAVEIELTAAANAAVGNKADVNVLGTATAAGNQQNASPNFVVMVVKK